MQISHTPKVHTVHFSQSRLSSNALAVVEQLHEAGFQAYLVGGCVRDLLLDLSPKDFDVATDATPEEIKNIFTQCRLVGRRFRLAHVRFGRETIEVATFRAHHSRESAKEPDSDSSLSTKVSGNASSRTDLHGMLLCDNVYGNIEEDAMRRDFTINALYYNPQSHEVIDYTHQALSDTKEKRITLIGEPAVRYREDPVRMLRAVRFQAKLGFTISADTLEPIKKLHPLLGNIPAARLFDEVLKLFHSGHALNAYHQLKALNLFPWLFPQTAKTIQSHPGFERMIELAFENTDNRISEGKSVTPAFLCAVLLWQPLCNCHRQLIGKRGPFFPMLQKASQQVLGQQCQSTSIPKRHAFSVREIWELQYRLDKRAGHRAEKLMAHPRFRAAYDFLLLREAAGEIPAGLGAWWTEYQAADAEQQKAMATALPTKNPRKKRAKKG